MVFEELTFCKYSYTKQGKCIKIIKYIDWEDVEEPCKGDTPA